MDPVAFSPVSLKRAPATALRVGGHRSASHSSLTGNRRGVAAATTRPPALLTVANYNGTLAAVRALGRAGIRVTTADPSRFAVSAWSRHAETRLQAPAVRDTDRFLEWLIAFGRSREKHVLLPTSDDTAWLYSLHRDELSPYFHLLAPPVDVTYRLLNKALLHAEASAAGLEVPRTWFPESAADLDRCCREARFPVLVKPRTQVLFRTQSKGAYVETAEELAKYYDAISRQPYQQDLLKVDPSAARPMVQEFHREATTGIYGISGYARGGEIRGARAARKVLQQPRRLGTGICFEEAPLLPDLLDGLRRLVRRLKFSGVFEAEFIPGDNAAVLIDFNPRFYNQMGLDIARGLPLPLLAYYDAIGDERRFDDLCAAAGAETQPAGRVFVDSAALHLMLSAQRMSGLLTRAERRAWLEWRERHAAACTDAVIDASDPLPAWMAGLQTTLRYVRHPRNFIRAIVLNR